MGGRRGQVLGQVGRDLHVSQQHLPRWPWLAKQRFFGFVFEKQWTSLALPATGLQFLAGNGPFLALSQTRPAAAPHLQHPNGPPWAEKAPKRANHQPIWPPVHGKASWGLATPNAGHLVWPPNLACWALCTFHSSFPPSAPPCGPGTPCPGTKMAKPAKMLRHHIVGGQLGCGLGLWITTWQV